MSKMNLIILLLLGLMILAALFPFPQAAFAGATVKWIVKNKASEKATIQLSGPVSYKLEAKKNASTKFDVVPGKYNYSLNVCGGTVTGEIDIRNNAKRITIPACLQLKFHNRTGGSVILRLNGLANYNLTFPPGTSKQRILPGRYGYTYYGCGTSVSGTEVFSGWKHGIKGFRCEGSRLVIGGY